MKKIINAVALVSLIFCSFYMTLALYFGDFEMVRFHSILIGVNVITLFFDRIMGDIQDLLEKIYKLIK